jgi:hypothetical protein
MTRSSYSVPANTRARGIVHPHSLRQRGVSFLRFVLGRERDMDAFTVGKRRRRRAPGIELYPKGYHAKGSDAPQLSVNG